MKNGMLFGSFNPLHLSHIDLIKKALDHFEILHVIIRNNESKDMVEPETKMKWLENVNETVGGRLRLYTMELPIQDKRYDKLDMTAIFLQSEKMTGKHIDGLICGEDMQYMIDTFKKSLPDREFIVIPRDSRSSTGIRDNIDAMKDDIPDFVYKDLKERGF